LFALPQKAQNRWTLSEPGGTLANIKSYREIITVEPGKRGGKPCIRHMRITV